MKYVHAGGLKSFPEEGFETIEARLWRIESIRAIEECIFSYTKSADTADYESMAACFSAEARLSWGIEDAAAVCGRDKLRRHFEKIVGKSRSQEHFCTNFQILFLSQEKAVGECGMFSWQVWKDASKPSTLCSGRYEFQAVVEEGEWRISSLRLTLNAKIENGLMVGLREAEQFDRPWPPVAIGEKP